MRFVYHLGKPKSFLETLSTATRGLIIPQTHFATDRIKVESGLLAIARRFLTKLRPAKLRTDPYHLSRLTENEGLPGRWYTEFFSEKSFDKRESSRWASWDNRKSFWIQRQYLIQAIQDVGFDLVLEQYGSLAPNIAESLVRGYYRTHNKGTFVGIKTS